MNTAQDLPLQPSSLEACNVLESDLVAATRLRAIAALRDGLEHDLRSPLNTIVLNIELLRTLVYGDAGDAPAQVGDRFTAIGNAIDRLQAGVSQLITLTEPPTATASRFDLGETVEEVFALARSQGKQKGVTLQLEPAPGPMRVTGRREAVRQSLLLLLVRAVEVSDQGAAVELRLLERDAARLIEIEDRGGEMHRDARRRIFGNAPVAPGVEGRNARVARLLLESEGGGLELAPTGEGSVFVVRLKGDDA